MKVSKPLAAFYVLAALLLALPGAWLLFAPHAFILFVHGGDQTLLVSPLLSQQTGLGLLLAAAVNLVCLAGGRTRTALHVAVFFYLAGLVASHGAPVFTLDGAWFYSDSHNDLPLLERVDHPVAVDPDDALREAATQRGWRILSLRD